MSKHKYIKKIVCVTPCSVHNDMRTLKEAQSLESAGYDTEIVFGSLLGSSHIGHIKPKHYSDVKWDDKKEEGITKKKN